MYVCLKAELPVLNVIREGKVDICIGEAIRGASYTLYNTNKALATEAWRYNHYIRNGGNATTTSRSRG
jgi:hypothetical protein